MKKILLCANSDRDGITEAIIERILDFGLEARVYSPFRPLRDFKYPELLSGNVTADAMSSDMLICMGGDGTILSCSKLAAMAEIPVLGINYGHKGFIAALEPDEIASLDGILGGSFETEDRMMLSAEVLRGGETAFADFGLNEAVVRSAGSHPVRITVFGDGVEITAFGGDGVIVATPTGSTAYSMSAGGPIVEPGAENLIITPICAHALNAKTVVMRGDRTVEIQLTESPSFAAVLAVDGSSTFALGATDRIIIKKSAHRTKLVSSAGRSFYELVKRKLNTDF